MISPGLVTTHSEESLTPNMPVSPMKNAPMETMEAACVSGAGYFSNVSAYRTMTKPSTMYMNIKIIYLGGIENVHSIICQAIADIIFIQTWR